MTTKLQAYMKSKLGHWEKWVKENKERHIKKLNESTSDYKRLSHVKKELESCLKFYVNDPIMLDHVGRQLTNNTSQLRQFDENGVRRYVIADKKRDVELEAIVEAAREAMEMGDYDLFQTLSKQIEHATY